MTGSGPKPTAPAPVDRDGKPPLDPDGVGKPPLDPDGVGKPPLDPDGVGKPPLDPDGVGKPPLDPDGVGKPPLAGAWLERRFRIALAIWAIVTVVCLLTTAKERLTGHTPFNHFALQAEAWLRGRLDLGGPPPAYTGNNDFAIWNERTYVSFPPVPALVLLPAVWLAGSAERVRDALAFLPLTGVGPACLFLVLDKLARLGRSRRSERDNIALALLFAFGTVYWFSAVQGTVWFVAHVVGVALFCPYLYFSLDARRPALAGLFLALAFGTRTTLGFAFPFFLFELWRAHGGALVSGKPGAAAAAARSLATFAAPAAAVLVVLAWHNHARFGDPFEFGHRLLAIAWRKRIDRYGLFSLHYLARNLSIVLAGLPFPADGGAPIRVNAHGLALWLTSPFYVWAIWPRRADATFCALAVTAIAVAIPSLLYQNSGWIQFGYRFSNDFAPLVVAMIAVGRRPLGRRFAALGAFALIVNAFGALTFQRAGWDRYYFVDPSQKILFPPDGP